ncbi:MAG: hypothetical protein LCH90_23535, partial [Proteobacteria bacterium]|nr:hypothetical protein [Pseudomonadota bacterium]
MQLATLVDTVPTGNRWLHEMKYDGYRVLLSVGGFDEAGHGDGGINAIHYLQGGPSGWQLKGEWLNLGSVGTMGNAATAWGFSDALGKNP